MGLFKRSTSVIVQDREIPIHIHGQNGAVGASVEDVWTPGGIYTGWLTTASAVRIKAGGNAADTALGLGATSIKIYGLDSNWNLATEVIATAGASASSATTTNFIRVYRVQSAGVGVYGAKNTGAIEVETTAGATVAYMEPDTGESQQTMFTIPDNYVGYLSRYEVDVEDANTAEVRLFERLDADIVVAPFGPSSIIAHTLDFTGLETIVYDSMPALPARTDIWVDAKRVSGGGNTIVDINYDILLKRD